MGSELVYLAQIEYGRESRLLFVADDAARERRPRFNNNLEGNEKERKEKKEGKKEKEADLNAVVIYSKTREWALLASTKQFKMITGAPCLSWSKI